MKIEAYINNKFKRIRSHLLNISSTYSIKYSLILIMALFLLNSCSHTLPVYSEKDIREIKEIASAKKKKFCMVLYKDSDIIFNTYLNKFNSNFLSLKQKAIFNFVNTNKEENQWYRQLLCLQTSVATCIFSSKGELINIIGGASSYSFNDIKESIKHETYNKTFGYKTPLIFQTPEESIEVMNKLFICKENIDDKKDIDSDINWTLEKIQYPYNVYLKLLNEHQVKKDTLVSIKLGEQLLNMKKEKEYATVYKNIFDETEYIVNPDYKPEFLNHLIINKDIYLPNCKVNTSKDFYLELENQGEDTILIDEIDLGCDCLQFKNTYNKKIYPNTKDSVLIQFTPRSETDSIKHILIISNAVNYFEQLEIRATIKR